MATLDWIGKAAVLNHHNAIPFRLLRPEPGLSAGARDSGNLIVQGDNLHALKALLPYYGGAVKCIYIDPPYNTGNEGWIYNDAVNSDEIREWLGRVVGGELDDLSRHDKWLCMMYPRLQLLKRLLREDGVIMVSIDDNELANLLLVMHEVFGGNNHIATLVWEKGKKGDAKFVSVTHEYVVIFARRKATLVSQKTRWRRRKPGVDAVLEKYQEVRAAHGNDHVAIRKTMMAWFKKLPKGDPAKAHKHYNWSDARGLYFAADFAGPDDGRANRPRYDILHPVTGKPVAKPSTGWRWEEERTRAALAEDPPRIHFGANESTIPNRKSYLFEVDQEPFQSVFYRDGRGATLQVEQLLGKGAFDFPKDTEIIADLVGLVTEGDDMVLDSFAGSGTTGHAVMELNRRDGGRRRFILVELDPGIAQEKTAVRVARAAERMAALAPDGGVDAGLGFAFCTLGAQLFDETGAVREGVTFAQLAAHVFFTETGTPLPRRARPASPLLGVHGDTAVYLLFNGILGDRRPAGGNILTRAVLSALPPHNGPRVIYGEGCLLGEARLAAEGITFRQTPYHIRT